MDETVSVFEGVADELRAWLEAMRLALGAEAACLWVASLAEGRLAVELESPRDVEVSPDAVPIEGHALGWVFSEGVSLRAQRSDVFRSGGDGWIVAAPLNEPRGTRLGCVSLEFAGVPRPDAPHALELAAALAGRLIGDVRAAEEAREDARRSEALYGAVLDLDRELDLRQLAAAICQRARRVSGARGAAVALWDHEAESGSIVATDGEVARGLEAVRVRGDDTYLGLALSNGTILPQADLGGRKALPLYVRGVESQAGSAVIVPMFADDHPVGAIAVEYEQPRQFSEKDLERLKAVSLSVAHAFRNAIEFGKVRDLSLTDALTGLPNRRATERALASTIAIAERTAAPFAVAVVDVDHFKRFNDRHGHDAGDLVLQTVARTIRKELRPGDHAGRWGGEEFLIVLPGAGLEDGAGVLERVRRGVEAAHVEWGGRELKVTLSAGLTACPEVVPAGAASVASADAALYAAKRSGRNNLVIAEPRHTD
jgi:diguanylate cyclase (GGDEF)-like protein